MSIQRFFANHPPMAKLNKQYTSKSICHIPKVDIMSGVSNIGDSKNLPQKNPDINRMPMAFSFTENKHHSDWTLNT